MVSRELNNISLIEYYLALFTGLRNNINNLIYKKCDLKDFGDKLDDEDLLKFSIMVMVSEYDNESFRWLHLEDQKKFVIKKLKSNDKLKELNISAEAFYNKWIKFQLKKSGLIQYFTKSDKDTEYIVDFNEEKFLIQKGYEKDYSNQTYFFDLRQKYRELLKEDFDPFVELENIWGFENVSFYYIKLPQIGKLKFIAIFPIISNDDNKFLEKADFIFSLTKNAVFGANLMKEVMDQNIDSLNLSLLKTAIISILVDSFSHNISAHSLAALKWWFQKRTNFFLEKSINLTWGKNDSLSKLQPEKIDNNELNKIAEKSEQFFLKLDKKDSTNDKNFVTLLDILKFMPKDLQKNFLQFESYVFTGTKELDDNLFNPRFPIALDYVIWPFFQYLRDKAAFWSGVTRDIVFGGIAKTWYEILYIDFFNNPLYLGTIANSEGITKLNIYIEVKGNNNATITEKLFLTIDLGLIEFELEENQKDKNTVSDNSNDEGFHTPYSFVRPACDFNILKKKLDSEEFKVYLPGGIVGEHALFTLFENTIRNVKHYGNAIKNIKKEGLNFCISIDNTDEKIFNVGVWIGHKTKLMKNNKAVGKIIFDELNKPILNENGLPKLGGNSQDKICAAMLYKNKFSLVEDKNDRRYPWLKIASKNATEIFYDNELNDENIKNDKGFIKKYFSIWKAIDYLEIDENDDVLDNENPGRSKFLVFSNKLSGSIRKKINEKIEEYGIIRVIELENNNQEFKPEDLYAKWINKFLMNGKNIFFTREGNYVGLIVKNDKRIKYLNKDSIKKLKFTNNDKKKCHEIALAHGGYEDKGKCNLRHHGKLIESFIKTTFDNFKNATFPQENPIIAAEIFETINTRIMIFDDRVYERFLDYDKCNFLSEKLFLGIFDENIKNFNKNLAKLDGPNFLILHLSFLEKFDNVKENDLNHFFKENIPTLLEKENIKIVITTGRGRSAFWDTLNDEYKNRTTFRPIESLLTAVEEGISFKDDFQIKYNLTKVLYGS